MAALLELDDLGAEISVRALAERASISRSAFYLHFKDLGELAEYLLESAFEQIGEFDRGSRRGGGSTGAEVARASLERLVQHFDEHRSLYASVFGGALGAQAQTIAQNAFTNQVAENLPFFAEPIDEVNPHIAVTYVSAGMIAVLASWIRGDSTQTRDQVIGSLIRLLPDWMADTSASD